MNPQPAVLETAALPVELLAYVDPAISSHTIRLLISVNHFKISVITPAPTVRPPSRMAKRLPVSNATGEINSTRMFTLSPGMTISTPSGRVIEPVMSMVRM